jgi:hypothetical protein
VGDANVEVEYARPKDDAQVGTPVVNPVVLTGLNKALPACAMYPIS